MTRTRWWQTFPGNLVCVNTLYCLRSQGYRRRLARFCSNNCRTPSTISLTCCFLKKKGEQKRERQGETDRERQETKNFRFLIEMMRIMRKRRRWLARFCSNGWCTPSTRSLPRCFLSVCGRERRGTKQKEEKEEGRGPRKRKIVISLRKSLQARPIPVLLSDLLSFLLSFSFSSLQTREIILHGQPIPSPLLAPHTQRPSLCPYIILSMRSFGIEEGGKHWDNRMFGRKRNQLKRKRRTTTKREGKEEKMRGRRSRKRRDRENANEKEEDKERTTKNKERPEKTEQRWKR